MGRVGVTWQEAVLHVNPANVRQPEALLAILSKLQPPGVSTVTLNPKRLSVQLRRAKRAHESPERIAGREMQERPESKDHSDTTAYSITDLEFSSNHANSTKRAAVAVFFDM